MSLPTGVENIASLKTEQFENLVDTARRFILERRLSVEPTRKQFMQERATVITFMDWLMFLLLFVLFIFSVMHIFSWSRIEAINSYKTMHDTLSVALGVIIPEDIYVKLHQFTVLGVSELGMLVLSMFHLYRLKFEKKEIYGTFVHRLTGYFNRYVFFGLAGACGFVVLSANLHSGFSPFVSLLIPALTIALSERFAQLFAQIYTTKQEADFEYKTAINTYRRLKAYPEDHKDFNKILIGLIVDWYKKHPKYKELDWTPQIERYLAARELHYANNRDNMEGVVLLNP